MGAQRKANGFVVDPTRGGIASHVVNRDIVEIYETQPAARLAGMDSVGFTK